MSCEILTNTKYYIMFSCNFFVQNSNCLVLTRVNFTQNPSLWRRTVSLYGKKDTQDIITASIALILEFHKVSNQQNPSRICSNIDYSQKKLLRFLHETSWSRLLANDKIICVEIYNNFNFQMSWPSISQKLFLNHSNWRIIFRTTEFEIFWWFFSKFFLSPKVFC